MTGSGDDARAIDSRFDPRFQPGYRTGDGVAAISTAANRAPAEGGFVQVGGSAQVGGPAQVGRTALAGASSAGSEPAPSSSPPPSGVDTEPPVLAPGRRNPFVMALWATSAILVLLGVGLLRVTHAYGEEIMNRATQADWNLIQAGLTMAPQMVVLGLATAVTALVLHATAHERSERERRRGEAAPD